MLDRDPRRMAAWAAAALVLALLSAWYLARPRPSARRRPTAGGGDASTCATRAAATSPSTSPARSSSRASTGSPSSQRVEDALKRAGGPTRRADLSQINRAAKLEDGRQILVPVRPSSRRRRPPRPRPPRRPRPAAEPQHRDARAARHARRRRPGHRPEDPRLPHRARRLRRRRRARPDPRHRREAPRRPPRDTSGSDRARPGARRDAVLARTRAISCSARARRAGAPGPRRSASSCWRAGRRAAASRARPLLAVLAIAALARRRALRRRAPRARSTPACWPPRRPARSRRARSCSNRSGSGNRPGRRSRPAPRRPRRRRAGRVRPVRTRHAAPCAGRWRRRSVGRMAGGGGHRRSERAPLGFADAYQRRRNAHAAIAATRDADRDPPWRARGCARRRPAARRARALAGSRPARGGAAARDGAGRGRAPHRRRPR